MTHLGFRVHSLGFRTLLTHSAVALLNGHELNAERSEAYHGEGGCSKLYTLPQVEAYLAAKIPKVRAVSASDTLPKIMSL